jgi:hypothetical protein
MAIIIGREARVFDFGDHEVELAQGLEGKLQSLDVTVEGAT